MGRDGVEAPAFVPGRNRRRWHFSGAVFDERSLELHVDGVPADLERKPLEVLSYLLQHAGEVCTKDELLAGVWPGRVLSETVLTKCIGRLREVLGDHDQTVIKTAYGFGYRLVAPVTVEDSPSPQPPRLDFRPGDHPPGRPLWSLVERLGVGGHGEAWRARHDKTNEQRVFKFALDESSLGALKREITLFRVINDSLGDSARVVRLLDWNLEHLPYFIESEYVASGSLVNWAKNRGGIGTIPLAERLEVMARVASALAAVHAVGVLHKDLKPSNVLVRPESGGLGTVLLADFGSGGVLDFDHLEQLGITRLGFTRTVASSTLEATTPLYVAPEIVAGQPFTVKADIYALGVMLYQMIVGDLHRIMSPGWEREVSDELLREDIALVAEGDPTLRLADAEVLAKRLRTLPERRKRRKAEREAQERAERASRMLERVRARRFGLTLAFAALIVGLSTSTVLYLKARRAQLSAETAAAQSKAVVEYLSNDVSSPVSSGKESVKEINVTALLARAGDEIDMRLAGQPQLASQLHFIIGRSLYTVYETALGEQHFQRSFELGEKLEGAGSESAMRSAAALVTVDYLVGRLRKTIPRYEASLDAGEARLGPASPAVLELRAALARGHYLLGSWSTAAEEFRRLLVDARAPSGVAASELFGEVELYYGQVLIDLAQAADAQRELRAATADLTQALGEKHLLVSDAHSFLGLALANGGDYPAALKELERAQELASRWAPEESWTEIRPRWHKALLAIERDEPQAAEPILAQIVRYEDDNEAQYLQSHQNMDVELDHTGPVRQALGEVYEREERLPEAIDTLKRAIHVSEVSEGPEHPIVISERLSLASCLIQAGQDAEARSTMGAITKGSLVTLPPKHPMLAAWNRVQGLLEVRATRMDTARLYLRRSLEIYGEVYGEGNWRVERGQRELHLLSK